MNDEKKFREFELFYSGMAGSLIVRNNYNAYIMQKQDIKDDEYIHVIEYSAYEQAQKEIEILRKAVQLQREGLEEIAANQAIGEVDLRGHFEGYQKYELLDCTVNDTEIARQTLKEVDELLKGER